MTQGINIVGVIAHYIAVLVGVKIADRQILHTIKELLAKLVQKALGHICHKLSMGHNSKQADNIYGSKQKDSGNYICLGGVPVARNIPLLNSSNNLLNKD